MDNPNLSGSYHLTRIVVVRFLAFIYCIAFLVALNQNEALIGSSGLLPARLHLSSLSNRLGNISNWSKFLHVPTLAWFCDYQDPVQLDWFIHVLTVCSLVISTFILITGRANSILFFLLWISYHSIVNIGQIWYSFGWESQLLESGFLAIFLVPVFSLSKFPASCPPPFVVIMAYRWMIFRIMIGAGLIKIRGDECWRDLTCMDYHYETQPVPNPLSFYLHKSPQIVHQFETLSNHFIELVAPWFILIPVRSVRLMAGIIQIFFQLVLIMSGNLSFLNWLTILPSICLFDDLFVSRIFSSKVIEKVYSCERHVPDYYNKIWRYLYKLLQFMLLILICFLSLPIISNLLSSHQRMNSSFDNFRLVNTYGAFGSVTKNRFEVIVEGTRSKNPNGNGVQWYEYGFKCKPGRIDKRPCFISPYHYRLDWLMWFAALENHRQSPWLFYLAAKLLINDNNTLKLIEVNPFEHDPPRFLRMSHYLYQYADAGNSEGHWWKRIFMRNYIPPFSLQQLMPELKEQGWLIDPKTPQREEKIEEDTAKKLPNSKTKVEL